MNNFSIFLRSKVYSHFFKTFEGLGVKYKLKLDFKGCLILKYLWKNYNHTLLFI